MSNAPSNTQSPAPAAPKGSERNNRGTINTAFGERHVIRRVGTQREYVFTLPTLSAPHGEWWTLNPQRGWVDVASNSRSLLAAIAADEASQ